MQLTKISPKEQESFISSFWSMLRECEGRADDENDPLLKHMVAGWYSQWNRVAEDNKVPCWVERAERIEAQKTKSALKP